MENWFKILSSQLLIVLIMLISGRRFSKRPPQNINNVIGIRTRMSMKHKDTWEFAHKLAGKLMWKWGWICLGGILVGMGLLWGKSDEVVEKFGLILMLVLVAPFIVITVYTDNALRKNFHEDGTRR